MTKRIKTILENYISKTSQLVSFQGRPRGGRPDIVYCLQWDWYY